MTIKTRNEAAEDRRNRLLSQLYGFMPWPDDARELVDAALAAERRRLVERIRAFLEPVRGDMPENLWAFLRAEAR